MNYNLDDEVDNYILLNIGMYWDDETKLAKDLNEKFGDIYTEEEWLNIARAGIDKHYS